MRYYEPSQVFAWVAWLNENGFCIEAHLVPTLVVTVVVRGRTLAGFFDFTDSGLALPLRYGPEERRYEEDQ